MYVCAQVVAAKEADGSKAAKGWRLSSWFVPPAASGILRPETPLQQVLFRCTFRCIFHYRLSSSAPFGLDSNLTFVGEASLLCAAGCLTHEFEEANDCTRICHELLMHFSEFSTFWVCYVKQVFTALYHSSIIMLCYAVLLGLAYSMPCHLMR